MGLAIQQYKCSTNLYLKIHTLNHYAKLTAISNLFHLLYTVYNRIDYSYSFRSKFQSLFNLRGWLDRENFRGLQPGVTWFLIAIEWWKKWKEFVGRQKSVKRLLC